VPEPGETVVTRPDGSVSSRPAPRVTGLPRPKPVWIGGNRASDELFTEEGASRCLGSGELHSADFRTRDLALVRSRRLADRGPFPQLIHPVVRCLPAELVTRAALVGAAGLPLGCSGSQPLT
jgi:hypothetical protein